MEKNPVKDQSNIEENLDFEGVIARIKEDDENPEETKNYIGSIMKVLDYAFENCDGEVSREEILEQFLEQYKDELEYRGNVNDLFVLMVQWRGYRDVLKTYKTNKNGFNKILREAKQKEAQSSDETLTVNIYKDKNMLSVLRSILRTNPNISEEVLIQYMQNSKNIIEKDLKAKMIYNTQHCMSFLTEYDFLDNYIAEANEQLDRLGLQRLRYVKRNPLPDGEYDKEDIGVIDSLDDDILNNDSPEDLALKMTFWQSKYWEERMELSKAMSTINTLNLWPKLLEDSEGTIESLDEEDVKAALKKDLALTYLYRHRIEITPKMEEQYMKFVMKCIGSEDSISITDDLKEIKPELDNLIHTVNDITIMQCLIIQQLREKNPKVKRWGVLRDDKGENENSNLVVIAIEHEDFRGPLIIGATDEILKDFFCTEQVDLPEYKKRDQIDDGYSEIMAKLFIQTSPYYKRVIKEEYKANPTPLLAALNGKTVKKTAKQPNGETPGGRD